MGLRAAETAQWLEQSLLSQRNGLHSQHPHGSSQRSITQGSRTRWIHNNPRRVLSPIFLYADVHVHMRLRREVRGRPAGTGCPLLLFGYWGSIILVLLGYLAGTLVSFEIADPGSGEVAQWLGTLTVASVRTCIGIPDSGNNLGRVLRHLKS